MNTYKGIIIDTTDYAAIPTIIEEIDDIEYSDQGCSKGEEALAKIECYKSYLGLIYAKDKDGKFWGMFDNEDREGSEEYIKGIIEKVWDDYSDTFDRKEDYKETPIPEFFDFAAGTIKTPIDKTILKPEKAPIPIKKILADTLYPKEAHPFGDEIRLAWVEKDILSGKRMYSMNDILRCIKAYKDATGTDS